MKLYRIEYHTPHNGAQIEWCGSKIDAAYACQRLVDEGFTPRAKPVNVPIEKAALLGWLNAHFNSDNG